MFFLPIGPIGGVSGPRGALVCDGPYASGLQMHGRLQYIDNKEKAPPQERGS